MRCTICGHTVTQTRHFDLYVIGSEGVNLCHDCEMDCNRHLAQRMRDYAEIKRAAYRQTQRNEIIREDCNDGNLG
jgi:ribosome-binding protein aMBF1 (putative translation factor)